MDYLEIITKLYKNGEIKDIVFISILFLILFWLKDTISFINTPLINKVLHKRSYIDFSVIKKKLNHIKDYQIRDMKISCIKRKSIFEDFARERVSSFILFLDGIERENYNSMSEEELYLRIKEGIVNVKRNSNSSLIQNGMSVDSLRKISTTEDDELRILDRFSKNVCFSKNIYKDNGEKLSIIFDFICVMSDAIIAGVESTIMELNGQLDSVVYKGINCDSCKNELCVKRRNKDV